MQNFDFFSGSNAAYLDNLYKQYLEDPDSVSKVWAAFFTGFEIGSQGGSRREFPGESTPLEPPIAAPRRGAPVTSVADQVQALVNSYRELGHMLSDINPLGSALGVGREPQPLLDLAEFGLGDRSLTEMVESGGFVGPTDGTLGGLVEQLRNTYCRTFAVEYMNIPDKPRREWLESRMEPVLNRPKLSTALAQKTLKELLTANAFEQFLQAKYVGQKRFSLEGADALIPLLENLIEGGSELGAEEFVLGMAHRGRLNVLTHTLHKPYATIFAEFEGTAYAQDNDGDGDVKYHLGYSNDRVTASGKKVHLSLTPNPSHLELVNPVVEGLVGSKQRTRGDVDRSKIVPVLIHGEAAFTGQGLVSETLTLSQLRGYDTGGTIHIIVNNQVGFTADGDQTRFTRYPTDVGKLLSAPIFHVNGDDPESVIFAAQLAIEFRQTFKSDVLIDLWCYRRHGHNEADDPTYTQPLMYEAISKHPPPADLFASSVLARGLLSEIDVERMRKEARAELDASFAEDRTLCRVSPAFMGLWEGFTRGPKLGSAPSEEPATKVDAAILKDITDRTSTVPEGFSLHPKLVKWLEGRREMTFDDKPADWGMAETWAFGSLLLEGTSVRLAGQDSERGTFSHRHSVFHDVKNGNRYAPLDDIGGSKVSFTVLNTMLSELAVLGYEFGYSMADPRNLVLWEAQFGDFVNGAQPIIDQFISSSESKWGRMSGLVMLLPHGYEGQGPEHSSARLERFLQLCAEDNLQVCYPTEPAQYFHLLRRQVLRNYRKPLIIMTPKSLLRYKLSTSPFSSFSEGAFHPVIDDNSGVDSERVSRLIFCSGKVYFTLSVARDSAALQNVAIVRVEQLYPFPEQNIQRILSKYNCAREILWAQEESRNMGAWTFFNERTLDLIPDLKYCGRDEAASPATGRFRQHEREEKKFITEALGIVESVETAENAVLATKVSADKPKSARKKV